MGYGRQALGVVGTSIEVSADGRPEAKIAGLTIDWGTVAAVSGSPVSLEDGVTIAVGEKYLRHGQVLTKIAASGKYGPYDPAAADGRQTLTRGQCFVLNRAAQQGDPKDEHPEAIEGGRVWLARILQSGVAAHSLAAGPTRAELEAAFPRLIFVE